MILALQFCPMEANFSVQVSSSQGRSQTSGLAVTPDSLGSRMRGALRNTIGPVLFAKISGLESGVHTPDESQRTLRDGRKEPRVQGQGFRKHLEEKMRCLRRLGGLKVCKFMTSVPCTCLAEHLPPRRSDSAPPWGGTAGASRAVSFWLVYWLASGGRVTDRHTEEESGSGPREEAEGSGSWLEECYGMSGGEKLGGRDGVFGTGR